MSTTRDRQRQHEEETESGAVASTTGRTLQGWLLILLVFVAGAASLAVELSASRLLAPYFGTSLFVWANLIGLILLYLTIGYYVGGRIADRYPRPGVLYTLTISAAFLIGLIPFISRPILDWSLSAFANVSVSVFYGSLVAVILLFAVPMILLGCVSPFAIRLRVEQVGRSGSTAGQLYAISTAGSILGTFLPVLWLIPTIGTYRTFFSFAVALLLVSIVGLIFSRPDADAGSGNNDGNNGRAQGIAPTGLETDSDLDNRNGTGGRAQGSEDGRAQGIAPTGLTTDAEVGNKNSNGNARRKGRFNKNLLSILLLLPMWLAIINIHGPIRPANGSNGGGTLIAERESAYNYIQVVKVGSQIQLVLNEGIGIHSIYDPNAILTGGPWDYFMVAPLFNNPPFSPRQVKRVAIIGLGAGTIAREMTAVYGPIPIDGVEIDGTIVQLGRQYFDMNEPNLHVIVQDGRYFLRTTTQHYDEIGIDAYQQPYVPFQLTTVEFFREVRAHLTSTGVAVINAGRTNTDFRLVDTLAETMRAVFPNVYIIDTGYYENSLVIGTNRPTNLSNFWVNTHDLTNPLLEIVAYSSIQQGNIREEQTAHVYYTDDRAPVEQLIDEIIFDAVEQSGK